MPEQMSDDRLSAIIDAEFEQAMGSPGGEIAKERALAWDYYMSKPLGNEIEGQSQVVTSDVSDVVDGIMPSLLRMFTTSDNLVSFDAVGPEDEALAQQESDYVNHIFWKNNKNSFQELFFWFFDALVQKNGIAKCWLDESECIETESYSGLTADQLPELLDRDGFVPTARDERQEEDPETGEMVTYYDLEGTLTTKKRRICWTCVPPDEYRISADCRSLDPSEARMVGQEREMTRTDLIEMGIDEDIVNSLAADKEANAQDNSEKIAKYDKTDERRDPTHDRSMDRINIREAFMRVDYDGDGKAELRHFIVAGTSGDVLVNEPIDRQPFHVLTPQPLPHKHFGMASAEKVMDLQQQHTTLKRQMFDNIYHTNNPRTAVYDQALNEDTLDDLMTVRMGGLVSFGRPVNEAFAPMTVPFVAADSLPLINYLEAAKRERTGVTGDGSGLDPEALKNIQQTVFAEANDNGGKMKIELIARVFAETGIKSLMYHIHELVRKHQDKPAMKKLRNQWVPVNPAEWKDRDDVTINIGLGIGTRERNLLHLNNIFEKQMAAHQLAPGLITTPKNLYNTLAEMVKNSDRKDPTMFFTDPGQQMMPPPNEEQMQIQRQQLELQQQQQQLIQRQTQLEIADLELKREKEMLRAQAEGAKMSFEQQKHQDEMMLKLKEREDKTAIELEKIANALTEMELKYQEAIEQPRRQAADLIFENGDFRAG